MSTKPNYFKLGLFILVAVGLFITAIILFGTGVFEKEKIYFETYFAEAVTGLTAGAPVLDQGVEVGTVEKIEFVRQAYPLPEVLKPGSPYRSLIRVVCSVNGHYLPSGKKGATQQNVDELIKHGLRLQLSTNILTGQGVIEAHYLNPERFPVEPFPWKPQYIFIPSAPSTFTTMKDSVDKILQQLEQINTKEIAQNINKVLVTVKKAVEDARVAEVRTALEKLLTESGLAAKELKELLKNPNPQEGLSNVPELIDRMNSALAQMERLIRSREPQVAEIIGNINQITENLKALTEDLKKTPSDIIFTKPPEEKEMLK